MSDPKSLLPNSRNSPASGPRLPQSIGARLVAGMLHRRVAWIALLLTLLMTLLIWKSTKDALLLAQQQQFENRAAAITTAVIRRLRSYEHLLRGGVGLFAASQSVSRTEWRDYVASLIIQEQYAGIQGIGFAAYIPAAHLNEHFRVIRAEGFPN